MDQLQMWYLYQPADVASVEREQRIHNKLRNSAPINIISVGR